MYIVYKEFFDENGKPERWYYGKYQSRELANKVAMEVNSPTDIYACVCDEKDVEELNILGAYKKDN